MTKIRFKKTKPGKNFLKSEFLFQNQNLINNFQNPKKNPKSVKESENGKKNFKNPKIGKKNSQKSAFQFQDLNVIPP